MKHFLKALQMGGMLLAWFESASADGKLTAAEIADGVSMLLQAAGYADKITVDPLQ